MGNRLAFGPFLAVLFSSMQPSLVGLVMSALESHPRQDEEADRLRRGLRAWCATADDNYDSAQDETLGAHDYDEDRTEGFAE